MKPRIYSFVTHVNTIKFTMSGMDLQAPPKLKSRQRLISWLIIFLALIGLVFMLLNVFSGRFQLIPTRFSGIVIQSPSPVANFEMTTHLGQPFQLNDLRGKVVLLYFGYTYCPDACPMTLVELKKAKAALENNSDKIQVAMISVDPERDTPAVLRDYLSYFDPSFIGLTGTEEQLLSAATPLGIYFNKHQGSAAGGYLVDHTTTVMAIDKNGYLRLVYPHGTSGEDIASDMKKLARE